METDILGTEDVVESVRQISTTVWIAAGLLVAGLLWLGKWAFTVLFVQGKGVSLVTIPFSRVAGRILEDRFVQKLADSKALPKLHIPASWEEFNRFNGHVAHRMLTYRELIHLVQAQFNGPSAVCMRVCVRYFEPDFVATFRTAERGFRDLDRIDGAVRRAHRSIHRELERRTEETARARIQAEKDFEMVRIRRKHAVAQRPASLWLRKRLGQTLGGLAGSALDALWSSREVRALRTEQRRLRRRLGRLRLEIAEAERAIFAEHEAEVAGLCLELIEHDRMFLQHLYHRFGLEVESVKFTVASGRILDLLAGGTEEAARARAALGLEADDGVPPTPQGLAERVRADATLARYVGLGPESVLEGTLEAYLRVKLLTGEVRLPGYVRAWVAHLPPPAELGRAQAEFGHFSHQLAWLRRPVPGMEVLPSGLVRFENGEEGSPAPPGLEAETGVRAPETTAGE